MRTNVIIILVATVLSVCAQAQQTEYAITQKLRLTFQANGIDGNVEVLIDSRLTPELQKQMWGVGDWSFVVAKTDPRFKMFIAAPPKPAVLRITNKAGEAVRSTALETVLARITEAHLVDGRTSFFVAVDYSVGFGSYAGITTEVLDIEDGHFQWAEAPKGERISLPDTLKTAWKTTPHHTNKDIVLIYCRPAKVQVLGREFVVGYVRYRYDHGQWTKAEKVRNGFWEDDDPFPPLSAFP